MALTIGHRRPADSPVGDTQAACDICGCRWLRSELHKDTTGRLVCPQEGDGPDELALSMEVSARAARPRYVPLPDGGGNYGDAPDPTHLTDGSHLP